MVRLWTSDRRLIGTTELRHGRFVMRAIRHAGMPYELIGTGADGVRDYRAMEPIRPDPTDTVHVIDAGGNIIARVAVPQGTIPPVVAWHGEACPLWTVQDDAGYPAYRRPDPAEAA